jgi:excinuclease UvrABC ATPase subunit
MSKISCVADGGRVVAVGTLEQIKADADSITGKYL